jgi:small subunit ribosomal protein S1
VLESYQEGDVVHGRVTKVVTFGAFVEILPGVEGLVHISELAQHHVENPREVVSQGDDVNVLILEIDAERRRLSLSLKRVEEGMQVQPRIGDEPATPELGLSEEVFAEATPVSEELLEVEDAVVGTEADEVLVAPDLAEEPESEALAEEPEAEVVVEEPEAEVVVEEPAAEAEVVAEEEPEADAVADEPEAAAQPEADAGAEPEPELEPAAEDAERQ